MNQLKMGYINLIRVDYPNLLEAINNLLDLSLDISLMGPVTMEQKANVAEDVDMNYR